MNIGKETKLTAVQHGLSVKFSFESKISAAERVIVFVYGKEALIFTYLSRKKRPADAFALKQLC